MSDQEPLVCSLSGPELIDRVTEWQQVSSQALSRKIESGRVISTFPADAQLLQQLRRLIAAEAECCSFMRFQITEEPDQLTVELRVPEGMEDALAVMLERVTESQLDVTRI